MNGNLKLILGVIWSLILHYQIGRNAARMPPRKLMLAWLNAVVPGMGIRNFNTDWNDGVALNGLLDYCKPGLSPNWPNLDRRNGLENCRSGMNTAQQNLGIPPILRPEDLHNPSLDEFSGMTFLSYFLKPDGPGYLATLNWCRKMLNSPRLSNFTTDWNDGKVIQNLVEACGGQLTPDRVGDPRDHIANCQRGMTNDLCNLRNGNV